MKLTFVLSTLLLLACSDAAAEARVDAAFEPQGGGGQSA